MARIISFLVLLAILIVVGVLSFEVLSTFLLPLFVALLLVVMFRPVHAWFVQHCRGRVRLAAALTTLAILLIVLIPMLWILARAATETVSLVSDLKQENLSRRLDNLRQRLKLELPPEPVQKTFADVDATLDRLHESLLLPAKGDEAGEAALRKLWEQDLSAWSKQLGPELDHWSRRPDNPPVSADHAAVIDKQRSEFEAAVDSIGPAAKDRVQALASVERARASLESLKEAVFGSPVVAWLKTQLDFNNDQLQAIPSKLRELAGPLALGTTQFVSNFLVEFVVGLIVMIVALYYFLADGPAMISAMMRLSPLDDRYEEQLLAEFSTLTRAVIVAMLLAAFIQGLLSGVGYFFAGFSSVFLLTVLTMLFAMVPFIGATAVWGSCCLWLFLHDGRPQAALFLALYGTFVVSLADNLIKPLVLHGRSNLHPLLALLSVLGGAKALGPIGLVVGPMVVAFLQTLLVMLRSEMLAMDASKASPLPIAAEIEPIAERAPPEAAAATLVARGEAAPGA